MIKKECLYCKKQFLIQISPSMQLRNKGNYCSKECGNKSPKRNPFRGEYKKCYFCFKQIAVPNYKIKNGQKLFCSRKCKYAFGYPNKSKGKRRPHTAGINSCHWKGGITSLYISIRECMEYDQWREQIRKRDNYACVQCGRYKHKGLGYTFSLNVDHYPITFAQLLLIYKIKTLEQARNCKELWNLDNGRTLCEYCHKLTPSYLKRLGKKDTINNMNPSISSMLPPQAVASLVRQGGSPGQLFQQNPMQQNQTPGSANYDPSTVNQPPMGSQQMQPQTPPMMPNGQSAQQPQISEAQMILNALESRLSHHSKITEKTVNTLSKMIEAGLPVQPDQSQQNTPTA